MSDTTQGNAVELVAAYLVGRSRCSAEPEEIASSLDLDVGQVRCALRELECDGVLDDLDEDY
jgi:hypothetical protein